MTQPLIHTTTTDGQITRWERRDHPYMGGLLYVEIDSQDLTTGQRFTQHGEVQTWECRLQEFLDGCFRDSIRDDFGADTLHAIEQRVRALLAPPDAPQTAPAPPQASTPQNTAHLRYSVTLDAVGPKKISVIKVTIELLNLGLKDTKHLVERAPVLLQEDLSKDKAMDIQRALQEVGATVTLHPQQNRLTQATPAPAASTSHDVFLEDHGRKKIAVIKALRELTGLGLKEAKHLSESTPIKVASKLSTTQAQHYRDLLEAAGAIVRIQSH